MSSTSETGHAINVSNWDKIIAACKGYGTKYNPAKSAIKIPAMEILLAGAQQSLKEVAKELAPFRKAQNERLIAIAPMDKLCTRILNALGASEVEKATVEDAKTYIRKIQGKRATPKKEDNPATPEDESQQSISASQKSFDNRMSNFNMLIELLKNEPNYQPNETELQTAALEIYYKQLEAANKKVLDATSPLTNARNARDKYLYAEKTGIYDLQKDVKKYVKSVFMPRSPEFRQISGLEFTKSR